MDRLIKELESLASATDLPSSKVIGAVDIALAIKLVATDHPKQ